MMKTVSLEKPENLIKPIKSIFGVQDTDQLVIILRMNLQFLMDNTKPPELTHESILNQFATELMSCVVDFARSYKIFVVPICSGTIPFNLINLFPRTLYVTTIRLGELLGSHGHRMEDVRLEWLQSVK